MNVVVSPRSRDSLRDRVSEAEWQTRVDLAACYRLIARHGWDDMLSTHISARVPDEPDRFLINPYGRLFGQITASSLVKVDWAGGVHSPTRHRVNRAGVNIHGAILEARADVGCVLHMHTNAGVAVSTLQEGLLPLNQRALYFMPALAYYDYEGLEIDPSTRPALVKATGDKWLVLLRNHGTLALGRSVGQAFVYAYFFERACQYQVETLSMGRPLVPLPPEVVARVPEQAKHFATYGQLEWPALLETLDAEDPSYRD